MKFNSQKDRKKIVKIAKCSIFPLSLISLEVYWYIWNVEVFIIRLFFGRREILQNSLYAMCCVPYAMCYVPYAMCCINHETNKSSIEILKI